MADREIIRLIVAPDRVRLIVKTNRITDATHECGSMVLVVVRGLAGPAGSAGPTGPAGSYHAIVNMHVVVHVRLLMPEIYGKRWAT